MTLGKKIITLIDSKKKRQIIILYIASMIGVLLGLLSSIVNTRFLKPSDYGDVRLVQNYAQLGATLLYLGYFISGSRLLALSENNQEKRNIRGAMLIIVGASATILFILITFCGLFYLNDGLFLLFIASFPLCIYLLLNNYVSLVAEGDNRAGLLSALKVFPYGCYVPLALFVFSNWGATSNLLMLLQGGTFCIIALSLSVLTKPSFGRFNESFQKLSKESKGYGNQVYMGSLTMIATTYVAGIAIGIFSDDNSSVGFYTLALTVTSPMSLLPMTIGVTYFRDFARFNSIPSKVLKASLLLTIGACLCFIVLIKPLVVWLYTEQYSVVGTFAMWLVIGASIHGLGDLFGRFLMSQGQGGQVRNSSIACGCIKLGGYVGLVYLLGVNGAIITTILADSSYCGLMLFYYLRHVRNNNQLKVNY